MKKRIFFLLFLIFKFVSAQENIIEIKNYVTDKVGLLTEEEFNSLNSKLKDFDAITTNQVVVLVIKDLGGISIERYAEKVFKKNKLGQEKEDNGVLLLISKNDRQLRIEVGYGLEHKLTDAKNSRIIREIITPEFKKEHYYKGLDLGVSNIISLISSTAEINGDKNEESSGNDFVKVIQSIAFVVFMGAFFFGFLFVMYKFFFLKLFESLINIYRGLIVGKIGFFYFFYLLAVSSFFVVIMIIPITVFSILIYIELAMVILLLFEVGDFPLFGLIKEYKTIAIIIYVSLHILSLIVIPLLIAFFKKKHTIELPIKLSFKTDKDYIKKYIPFSGFGFSNSRGYSSSGTSSYSSSSSSSSSFSGGGGSSGGGGASGSW